MQFIGARIREARIRRGLSQEALADRLGVSKAAVSGWETGKSRPFGSRLAQLAETLGVDAGWLTFGGEQGEIAEILSRLTPRERAAWIEIGKAMAAKKEDSGSSSA